jgi:hypothetical protein
VNARTSPIRFRCMPYFVTRITVIFLTLFSPLFCTAQTMSFSQRVYELFFGVNVCDHSASLIDSFRSVPKLHYRGNAVKQLKMDLSIQMDSEKSWSNNYEFSFLQSPISEYRIDSGIIIVTLGETESIKRVLDLKWRIQFLNELDASEYFNQLKRTFSAISTNHKYEFDEDVGHVAQFSCRSISQIGITDITFFLNKSSRTGKFEVSLLFGTEWTE